MKKRIRSILTGIICFSVLFNSFSSAAFAGEGKILSRMKGPEEVYTSEEERIFSDNDPLINGVKDFAMTNLTYAAIREDNSLWMWGSNCSGQIGIGESEECLKPAKVLKDVKKVVCYDYGTAAITTDGKLYLWGEGDFVCDHDWWYKNNTSPTEIKDFANVKDVYISKSNSRAPTCAAITYDGDLWMWGYGTAGQLGPDHRYIETTAVRMHGNIKQVWPDNSIVAALSNDGKFYMWGGGFADTPTVILENIKEARQFGHYYIGITYGDEVYYWSDGTIGMSLSGKQPVSTEPVKVIGIQNAAKLCARELIITSEGKLYQINTDNAEACLVAESVKDAGAFYMTRSVWSTPFEGIVYTTMDDTMYVALKDRSSGEWTIKEARRDIDSFSLLPGDPAGVYITKAGELYQLAIKQGDGTMEKTDPLFQNVKDVLFKDESLWEFDYAVLTKDKQLYMKGSNQYGRYGDGTTTDQDGFVKVVFGEEENEEYTVTFDTNGGSVVDPLIIESDNFLPRPADPVKDGYSFDGWYKDSNYQNKWIFETDKVSADMTLYAKWTEKSSENEGSLFTIGVDNNHFAHNESTLFNAGEVKQYGFKNDSYCEQLKNLAINELEKKGIDANRTAPWKGSCYGIATTMGMVKIGRLSIGDISSIGARNYHSLEAPVSNPVLYDSINFYQCGYSLTAMRNSRMAFAVKNSTDDPLKPFLQKLVESTKNNNPVVLSYWEPGGGHSILALNSEYDSSKDKYIVTVYDENCAKGLVGKETEKKSEFIVESDYSSFSYKTVDYNTILENTYTMLEIRDLSKMPLITKMESVTPMAGEVEPGDPSGNQMVLSIPWNVETTIVNSKGEQLMFKSGKISGSMKVYDRQYTCADSASRVELFVDRSEKFSVTSGAMDAWIIDSSGTMIIRGDEINYAELSLSDKNIKIIGNSTNYKFEGYISSDKDTLMSLSGSATGDTNISVDGSTIRASSTGALNDVSSKTYRGNDTTVETVERAADGSVHATASEAPVGGITITPATATIAIGKTTILTAKTSEKRASISWTSSNEKVARVENGVVTGVSAGTATITATAGETSATALITVVSQDTNYCIVTFDSCGGSAVAPQTVAKGGKATKPADPTKEYCSFVGWYTEESYINLWDFSREVSGDMTLYARWYEEPYVYVGKKQTLNLGRKIKKVTVSPKGIVKVKKKGKKLVIKGLKPGTATIKIRYQKGKQKGYLQIYVKE